MSSVSSSTSSSDILSTLNTQSTSTSSTSDELSSSFLTLLTTQLQNQDPLDPLDNAELTSQLAQINTVQGLQDLNTSLSAFIDSYGSSQALQAAALIGNPVLTTGDGMTLSEGAAVGGVQLDSAADSVVVTIKDSKGNVVSTEDLGSKDAGTFAFSWDGKDADGNQLDDGEYTFEVSATSSGTAVTATALQVSTISAVVKSGSSYVLELSSGEAINIDDVLQFL